MDKLTRRQFLCRAAGLAAGCGLGHHFISPTHRLLTAQAAPQPLAAAARGTDADTAATLLETALEPLGGIAAFVKPGQTVVIKPNATWAYPPGTASSTDPDLLRALILAVRAAGARRIIVMDHCSLDPGSADCLRISGLGKVVEDLGVEGVFPDRYLAPAETYTQIALPAGKAFKKLGVIKAAAEADVRINMAVAKSHLVTKYTMCLKHMMGFLEFPGGLHTSLEQGIADLSTDSPIKAQLHILEAIRVRLPVGNKRQAGGDDNEITNPKRVRRVNEIVAGTDPVLIDAYGCINYFSIKPLELAHVDRAARDGLGEIGVDKALADGRLVVRKVGQPTPTPTVTATATPALTATAQAGLLRAATPTPVPTNMPLPTAVPEAATTEAVAPASAGAEPPAACSETVQNPNRFLSGALIPVAAVVAGASVVVRSRLRGGQPPEEKPDDR